ncbi:MAG TPA: prepilin-type N-terminal cleavage/methylation domain-containing protein [Candidatus Wallbacteria bacterium]|nr:prepilin-type N-terminal cleavage/methylation domain-containing protein [Candidatus Wallbacteria bacterium]
MKIIKVNEKICLIDSCKRRDAGRRAFTMVETMISIALFSMVITVGFYIFNYFSKKIPGLNEEVAVQRVYRTADQLLEKRLARAVEIIEPSPVKTLGYVKFRELDGRIVVLKAENGALASFDAAGVPEKADEEIYPVYIKNVESVNFTALSYGALMIGIKFKNSGEKDYSGSIFVVRFKNVNSSM